MTTQVNRQARRYRFDSAWLDLTLIALSLLSLSAPGDWIKSAVDGYVNPEHGEIMSGALGLHGTMLGFVLAAFAIVLGYIGKPTFKLIRDSGQTANINRIFVASISTHALGAAFAFAGVVGAPTAPYQNFVAWVTGVLMLLSGARLIRVLWVTRQIVAALR